MKRKRGGELAGKKVKGKFTIGRWLFEPETITLAMPVTSELHLAAVLGHQDAGTQISN
jgi:hypothetical protein